MEDHVTGIGEHVTGMEDHVTGVEDHVTGVGVVQCCYHVPNVSAVQLALQ